MKISVAGAGSWGSAIALLAARSGHDVLLWAHDPAVADSINTERRNFKHLPDAPFGDSITATNSLGDLVEHSRTVLMVAPSHHYRTVLGEIAAAAREPLRVVSGTKGIENETLQRISEVTKETLGEGLEAFAVLSGPNFAGEVAAGVPTASVVASRNEEFSREIQRELSDQAFRIYRLKDVVGVEVGGSMKNVIAIASGVIEGLGLGSNTTAALVTRGLAEMKRLGVELGARGETFSGLAGVGDLMLTCTGSLSRNRRVGIELGRGRPLAEILEGASYVAEGVRTTRSATQLATRTGVEMPITFEMNAVLFERLDPEEAIRRLMTRKLRAEYTEI